MSTLRIRPSLLPLLLISATGACSETAPPFDHGLEGSGAMAGTAGSAGVAGTAGTASGGMAGTSGAGATGGMTPIIPIPEPAGGAAGMAGSAGTAGTAGTGGRMVTDDCAASMATATDMTTIVPADIIFAIDTSS